MAVEVMQFEYNSEYLLELSSWMGPNMGTSGKARSLDAKGWLEVMSFDDDTGVNSIQHIATEGDYIIKDPFGDFWPVKPSSFELTYEEIIE